MKTQLRNYLAKIGAKGGKKSKRVLTPEQARAMVKAREKKRRAKAKSLVAPVDVGNVVGM